MKAPETTPGTSFPIVGIGASAGGLNALQCFLAELPRQFDFAVVFMQHLPPKHKSLLPELLNKRRPDIEIIEITDGMEVLPGRLYLVHSGMELAIKRGTFRVSLPAAGHFHLPIDEFFSSLAEDAGERAIGVIFSGAGTDGARGIRAIRNMGGTVFVQDPESADFAAMPAAAINTGQADAVLPPEEIVREIVKLRGEGTLDAVPEGGFSREELGAFYRLIRGKTGYRFDHYKGNVVGRRIRRRMHLRGISSIDEYVQTLQTKEGEAAQLAADLMIGVTSFFRDRLAWKALRIGVIRKLAAEESERPVRVWTPACSTGEESYSIAMMLHNEFELAGRKREIHVFATDVNEHALEKAREGRYPGSIAADVSPEFMRKFFTCSQDGLSVTISKEIRESVVFARQDLLSDPPFSRLDLILCRNFLIYLEPDAQEKCIALFHYALKDGGCLFLGNAESMGRNKTLFTSLPHKKCRIYQKVGGKPAPRLPFALPVAAEGTIPSPVRQTTAEHQQSAANLIQEALLEQYAPAAVAVDHTYTIIYHNGPTSRYLRQPRGAPSHNLLELLSENLRRRVRSALYRTRQEGKPVSLRTVFPPDGGTKRHVTFRISMVKENLFLIVFREKREMQEGAAAVSPAVPADEAAVLQLESELSTTRTELQSSIEQLKSLNEEFQASNEELQASNEELETSREELQSLNEELITVNSQLQSKIEEQEETNNDLNNFLASTNMPTLFLDHRFCVKRFTPAMSKLLKLIPADVGRSIVDMSQESLGPDLIADAQQVLADLVPIRKEVRIKGTWYLRNSLPYRTSDNRIEGIVITYNDVSELKRAEERTRHLASFPQLNPNPVLEIDASGTIVFSNAATKKVLTDLAMDTSDITVFLPRDIGPILEGLKGKEEYSLYRELELADRVYAEIIYLAPQFNVVRIYAYDITSLKRAESVAQAHLTMLETFYKADISLDDMLRLALDEIETQTHSTIGFYHFMEADQETLSLQNWSTRTLQDMCTAEGKGSHYPVSQAGVWVDCVRERRPVIHNDYASLPHRKGMPPGHAPVVREMVVPIMRGDRIVAIIGVGNKSTDYTAADVDIASQLGDFSWEIAERKRTEEALRASWARTRSYIEVTGQLGWTTNAVGEVVEDLPSWRAFTGQTSDGIKGWGWAQALHPDDIAHTAEAWRKAVAEKRTYEVEYRIQRYDGIYRHFMARGIPVFAEDGSVREWVGTCIDITERKQAEEALRESRADLSRAQEVGGIGSWRMDVKRNILTWSDETHRIFGIPKGTPMTYETFIDAVHPDDRGYVNDRWKAGLRGEPYDIEHRLIADGRVKWVREKAYLEFDQQGELLGGFGITQDITERKRADEALQKSLAHFELLTATAGELLRSTEPQKVVESVCRKAMEYLDCHAFFNFLVDERAGKLRLNAVSGISEEEAGRIEWLDFGTAVCGCAARDGQRIVAERIPTTPDERTELLESYGIKAYCCHPLLGPGGKVLGTLSFGTSSRETFSEDDLSLMKAVTDQVAVAMIRMRNEADVLKLSEDMAERNVDLERGNSEMEAFIYSISHDLRAPLRSIAGFARLLAEDCGESLDERGKDYLNRIRSGSAKMSQLIDDLLRLSRISRQDVDKINVDLTRLAASVISELRSADPGRQLEISIQKGLSSFADPRLTEIALSNLLGNAWKFTSKTKHPLIEFGALERDGKTVYFVRDNGSGFDPEYKEKMFWPFQRLHSEKDFEGTGIGLTIVERIVHRHGGKIWADGEAGKGATVYFTLS